MLTRMFNNMINFISFRAAKDINDSSRIAKDINDNNEHFLDKLIKEVSDTVGSNLKEINQKTDEEYKKIVDERSQEGGVRQNPIRRSKNSIRNTNVENIIKIH